jgi:hypothetical protein
LKYVVLLIFLSTASTVMAMDPSRVEFTSYDKARVGMSEAELSKVFKAKLIHIDPVADEKSCYYGSFPSLPKGVGLMILNGLLARVDVFKAGILTSQGAGVGMSERSVEKLYGAKLTKQPHAYTGPEGHYLTVVSVDHAYGIRFETDGKTVTGYYAGLQNLSNILRAANEP